MDGCKTDSAGNWDKEPAPLSLYLITSKSYINYITFNRIWNTMIYGKLHKHSKWDYVLSHVIIIHKHLHNAYTTNCS